MKLIILHLFVILLFFSNQETFGQNWKEIVPLVSTCQDVKRAFNLNECKFPITRIEFPKFNISVYFKRKTDDWNVSSDTVVNMTVIFKDLPKLREYGTDFTGYIIKPEDDAPEITIYKNDKKGVLLSVQMYNQPEPYISSILVYPTELNSKKFRCKSRKGRSSNCKI